MPVSTETDADVMFIAMVAETTEQSRWPSSTGVGTDMHSSTRALQDDEAVFPSPGSGVAPPLANEDRSDIVRIRPQAEYREQGDTQRPTGSVPSRAATVPTAHCSATPADAALSRAAPADTASRPLLPLGEETPTLSALSSVSDAITRL